MSRFHAALVLLMLSAAAGAQDELSCGELKTNLEIGTCQAEKLAQAERELDEEYRAILKLVDPEKAWAKNLRSSQHAWLMFRDAELDLLFSCDRRSTEECYGREYSAGYLLQKTRLTLERVERLRTIRQERLER